MDTITTLTSEAEATHAEYPQYRDHWNDWTVAVAKRDVKSRGAVIVSKGDSVLFNPASRVVLVDFDVDPKSSHATFDKRMVGKEFGTFYCPKNLSGCDTSLRTDYFVIPA